MSLVVVTGMTMLMPTQGSCSATTVGELCVQGDWACMHGDISALRHVAEQLAAVSTEPLHCELIELMSACNWDRQRAEDVWWELKEKLYRSSAS